jgi:hypothetical protein
LKEYNTPPINILKEDLEKKVDSIRERRIQRDRLLSKMAQIFEEYQIDYTIFKTLNKLGYVGVDIDVMIHPSDYDSCIDAFMEKGLYSIDDLAKKYATGFMEKGSSIIIDLHTDLAILGLRYLSPELLMDNKHRIDFHPSGGEIFHLNVTNENIDAFMRMIHSIIKEASIRIDDIAEVSPHIKEPGEFIRYSKMENHILTASIFSYLVSSLLKTDRFKPLVRFEDRFNHHLTKAILRNHHVIDLPLRLPTSIPIIFLLDKLEWGKNPVDLLKMIKNLVFRRNAQHFGKKIISNLVY